MALRAPGERPDKDASEASSKGTRTVEATVVDESPIGDGRCTQKSYEIRPTAGSREPFWVHFSNCYGEPGEIPADDEPLGLEVGTSYRFVLRDEPTATSPAPQLVSVEPL